MKIALRWLWPYWWEVSIGLGTGLAPSCNRLIPESMLIPIYVAKWRHKASMSWRSIPEYIATEAPTLQWSHNERDGVSNHRRLDCLLNRLFSRRSKTTSKLRVTGLCEWNLPGTGEFPAQRASNAENVSIWWRHDEIKNTVLLERSCD